MESTAAPSPRTRNPELWAGVALCALLATLLALGGTDVVSHRGELRPLATGDLAPDFNLPTPAMNARIALASLRGRVVLMDFWATWCPPCLRELPELATLHTELQDQGFTVLAINREPEDVSAVRRFVDEKRLPFPVVVDNDSVGERYRMVSLPMTVLLDRDGRILHQFMGYTPPPVLRAAVETALRQHP